MGTMVKIWDLPTRIFHWSLVLLFIFMIISGESDDLLEWHFYAGYLMSGLILFRVLWWFLGTRYARFSALKLSPMELMSYSKDLLRSKHTPSYGHTPPGSMMVVLVLVLLTIQLLTGMMSTDDIIWNGPFYNYVSGDTSELSGQVHEVIQLILQILVGIHVLAIILYKVKFKEALVPAMVHGKKTEQGDEPAREDMSLVKLLIAALPSAGLTYWLFSLPI
ncbi:cytochrome b/b6 domain-containing protein [Neptuniibacter sp.]|uniref:cytochrome b/b6 domain-containing protein n=1 Tax=Neptuniibacter sp. TaxID=1962643 RepID=UPI002613BBF3|nr:cytochrome b/b6 domain-containing protein [Neptuniibacter sp.]MCP4597958.1 branched-chain alpha-keto acid dehydrogenase subunit E2 [Neptuniibacter sp.]